ncbi:MAG: complex I NDUFA9 subunit family protein [Acetobacteraceae bacterium]|nr:complex I NDUFA9 subunit family protein [Acetobacteraceae bacterium]
MADVATVFGGSGFIGRYVVRRLARAGKTVRVAVRDTEQALFLKTAGSIGQVVPLHAPVTDDGAVKRAVAGADWVVNLVGILTESRAASFQSIHVDAAARIAAAAKTAGVKRLIHVSALGADPTSDSRYAATKGEGEAAVRAAFPEATILRPSIVFGPEDDFFNRFAAMSRILPFMPVIQGASRMQPVFAGDVADAVLAALLSDVSIGKTFELGGPKVWLFVDLLAYILKVTGRDLALINMPVPLVRLQAWLMERLPGKLLTRDQLRLLAHDNVVASGALGLNDLGLSPMAVEQIVPDYLTRYRPGGGRRAAPQAV